MSAPPAPSASRSSTAASAGSGRRVSARGASASASVPGGMTSAGGGSGRHSSGPRRLEAGEEGIVHAACSSSVERLAQAREPGHHARLDGAERHAGLRRDLRLAAALVEAAAQHVGLLDGEAAEQRGQPPALEQLVELEVAARVLARRAGIARLGDAAAQVVDRPRARDRHDPGQRRAAAGVVVRAALPDLEEHLLHDVLGRAAVAERVAQEAEDGRAEVGVEVLQRLRVAPAQAAPRGGGRRGSAPGPRSLIRGRRALSSLAPAVTKNVRAPPCPWMTNRSNSSPRSPPRTQPLPGGIS